MVKNQPSNAGDVRDAGLSPRSKEDPLEKETANLSSILAWRITWTEEPGGLQCMGSQKVRHDCSTLALSDILWVNDDGRP